MSLGAWFSQQVGRCLERVGFTLWSDSYFGLRAPRDGMVVIEPSTMQGIYELAVYDAEQNLAMDRKLHIRILGVCGERALDGCQQRGPNGEGEPLFHLAGNAWAKPSTITHAEVAQHFGGAEDGVFTVVAYVRVTPIALHGISISDHRGETAHQDAKAALNAFAARLNESIAGFAP